MEWMRPVLVDRVATVAWSVCLSVSRSVTVMSPAKMAELIKMLFWGVNLGGPKEPWIR